MKENVLTISYSTSSELDLQPQVPRMLVTWATAVHRPIVVEYHT